MAELLSLTVHSTVHFSGITDLRFTFVQTH